MAFIGLCPGLVKTMLRAQKLDVEVVTLKARKKSREACPHRLNITGTRHTIRNKLGKIMEPRKLEAGS